MLFRKPEKTVVDPVAVHNERQKLLADVSKGIGIASASAIVIVPGFQAASHGADLNEIYKVFLPISGIVLIAFTSLSHLILGRLVKLQPKDSNEEMIVHLMNRLVNRDIENRDHLLEQRVQEVDAVPHYLER